jgi:hypothetical protein
MLFWIAVLLYWFGSRFGVGVRWGATTSAQVRPAGSSGLTSANRLRNASLHNLLLGRLPGFPLDPFFHLVPAPIFGSNIRTSARMIFSNALTIAIHSVSNCLATGESSLKS